MISKVLNTRVYTLQDIYETMYHDSSIISLEEVFEPINNLITNKNKTRVLRKTR